MKKYLISYGLGGGFGGATQDDEIYEFENEDQALEFAYQKACEEYESYAGSYGLRTIEDIMDEEEVDGQDAEIIYYEECDSWVDYSVEEIK